MTSDERLSQWKATFFTPWFRQKVVNGGIRAAPMSDVGLSTVLKHWKAVEPSMDRGGEVIAYVDGSYGFKKVMYGTLWVAAALAAFEDANFPVGAAERFLPEADLGRTLVNPVMTSLYLDLLMEILEMKVILRASNRADWVFVDGPISRFWRKKDLQVTRDFGSGASPAEGGRMPLGMELPLEVAVDSPGVWAFSPEVRLPIAGDEVLEEMARWTLAMREHRELFERLLSLNILVGLAKTSSEDVMVRTDGEAARFYSSDLDMLRTLAPRIPVGYSDLFERAHIDAFWYFYVKWAPESTVYMVEYHAPAGEDLREEVFHVLGARQGMLPGGRLLGYPDGLAFVHHRVKVPRALLDALVDYLSEGPDLSRSGLLED